MNLSYKHLYFYELVGMYGLIAPATLLIGIVCSQILPGPLITVLKIPSPPNSIFFTPGTLLISI